LPEAHSRRTGPRAIGDPQRPLARDPIDRNPNLPHPLGRRLVKMAEEHGSPVAGGLKLRIS